MGLRPRLMLAVGIAMLLAGCATVPPLEIHGVNRAITPLVAASPSAHVIGQRVVWGGTIVQARNLRDHTELEVLAYPLDAGLAPDTSAQAQGRFLVDKAGYLETVDYAPGRDITLVGIVQGVRSGKVGAAPYRFPVVTARQLYLWPEQPGRQGSNVQFGVGVGVMVR